MVEIGAAVGLAALAVGGLMCFFGYALFRFFLALAGFIVVGAIAAAIAMAFTGEPGAGLLAFIVGGVIGAAVNVALYLVGVFMTGFLLGAVLAAVPPLLSGELPSWALILVLAFIGGVVALHLEKFLIILSTSFSGAFLIVLGIGAFMVGVYLPRFDLELIVVQLENLFRFALGSATVSGLAWFGLGIAGVAVQYQLTARREKTATRPSTAASSAGPRQLRRPAGDAAPAFVAKSAALPKDAMPAMARTVPEDAEIREVVGAVLQTRADVAYVLKRVHEQATADRAGAARAAEASLSQRSREARDLFRQELDRLRSEVYQAVREGGPALTHWHATCWHSLAGSPSASDVADAPIRIGDLNVYATDDSEDILSLPATVPLSEVGAVIVSQGPDGLNAARAAFVGLCLRLVAISGPGRVAIAWFDTPEAFDEVPAAWRASLDEAGAWSSYYRAHVKARLLRDDGPGGADTLNVPDTRLVVVAVGAAVGAVSNLRQVIESNAANGAATGVHLLLAPGARVEVDHPAVLHLRTRDGSRRLALAGAGPGYDDIVLQAAPPKEVTQRVVEWCVPAPTSLPAVANPAVVEGLRDDAPSSPSARPSVPRPVPVRAAQHAGEPAPGTAPTMASGTESAPLDAIADLERMLAAPPAFPPALTVGLGESNRVVRLPVPARFLLRGGTAPEVAAVLASYLIEIACQSASAEVEFAVLDLSDEPTVADHFDALLDILPHMIDLVSGVAALLALEDVVRRSERGRASGATLYLFVIVASNADGAVLEPLLRILRDGSAAGIVTIAWLAAATTEHDVLTEDGLIHLTLDGSRGVLKVDADAARSVRLRTPISSSQAKAITESVRRSRS